jgi:hypothetical protein
MDSVESRGLFIKRIIPSCLEISYVVANVGEKTIVVKALLIASSNISVSRNREYVPIVAHKQVVLGHNYGFSRKPVIHD